MLSNVHAVFSVVADTLPVDVQLVVTVGSLVLAGRATEPLRRWLWRVRNAQRAAHKWRQFCARARLNTLCEMFAESYLRGYEYPPLCAIRQRWTARELLEAYFHNHGRAKPLSCSSIIWGLLDGFKAVCMLAKGSGDPSAVTGIVHRLLLEVESTGFWICYQDFEGYLEWIDTLDSCLLTRSEFGDVVEDSKFLDATGWGEGGLTIVGWIDMVKCNFRTSDGPCVFPPEVPEDEELRLSILALPKLFRGIAKLPDILIYVILLGVAASMYN